MARDLVNMRPVCFSGKLYSREHSQHFETEHSEARLMRDKKGPGGFQLFIDRTDPAMVPAKGERVFGTIRDRN